MLEMYALHTNAQFSNVDHFNGKPRVCFGPGSPCLRSTTSRAPRKASVIAERTAPPSSVCHTQHGRRSKPRPKARSPELAGLDNEPQLTNAEGQVQVAGSRQEDDGPGFFLPALPGCGCHVVISFAAGFCPPFLRVGEQGPAARVPALGSMSLSCLMEIKGFLTVLRRKKETRSSGPELGGSLLSTSRQYKTKPTHGIGKYKHLIEAQEPKKKRGKVEMRPINLGTDYEYGVLNIHLTAYDMTMVESYSQYVHSLCNHLSVKVEESYAMPTKTMEVMRLQDQGNKMLLDSVLTTHERVVQISGLSATFAEIFLEILQSNLPEGVRLSVREHTEEDFKGRFKARPELEELLAKLN
ncbi:39S ribosomal protein L48, mitochondrial [Fukomys damarensis]|uniref:Large ribosomal subunit protein mL48 n=1 Tax=Fukomys damarensis TaxID=885580 RepID=A0A091D1G8_FUKDA|nr:39S ribosomal protein L48, mitochondrial [Fukomys damarensis]